MYCKVMEREVTFELGECDLKVGSILGQSSCPYKNSITCPLTGKNTAIMESI
jgi:hypothetical protein